MYSLKNLQLERVPNGVEFYLTHVSLRQPVLTVNQKTFAAACRHLTTQEVIASKGLRIGGRVQISVSSLLGVYDVEVKLAGQLPYDMALKWGELDDLVSQLRRWA